MKLFSGILLIVLLLMLLPLKVKGKIGYNVFKNQGYLSLFFFNLKLFLAKWKLTPSNLQLYSKTKTISIYFNTFKNQTNLGDIYVSNLLKKIKIKNLRIIANFGFNADQMISCLGGAGLDVVLKAICCILQLKKPSSKLDVQVFTSTNRTGFIVCGTTSIQVNLMILLVCFVKSLFRKINLCFKRATNKE